MRTIKDGEKRKEGERRGRGPGVNAKKGTNTRDKHKSWKNKQSRNSKGQKGSRSRQEGTVAEWKSSSKGRENVKKGSGTDVQEMLGIRRDTTNRKQAGVDRVGDESEMKQKKSRGRMKSENT